MTSLQPTTLLDSSSLIQRRSRDWQEKAAFPLARRVRKEMAVQPSKTLGVRTKDMILVVEDDAPSGRSIALALKTAGHEVMNAGEELKR